MNLWKEDYRIGVADVDAQHRELFAHIDALMTAIEERHPSEETQRTVAFMERYAREHFAAEERLMDECGYPNAHMHKLEHQDFINDLSDFKSRIMGQANDDPLTPVDLLGHLIDWLINHVMSDDMQIGEFLRRRSPA